MRRWLSAALLTAVAAFGSGCSGPAAPDVGGPPVPGGEQVAGRSAPPRDPAAERSCRDAQQLILTSTSRFTTQLDRAVTAGERGDRKTQAAAMTELRTVFRDWSAGLRQVAGRSADPAVAAMLTEYAGGVDATIARVESAEDLDKLYTFTEKELDIAADRFANVCG